ncbi:MAG: DUF4489 domain-containing protein [Lachnospiraceae bacterium]
MNWYLPNLRRFFTYRSVPNRPYNSQDTAAPDIQAPAEEAVFNNSIRPFYNPNDDIPADYPPEPPCDDLTEPCPPEPPCVDLTEPCPPEPPCDDLTESCTPEPPCDDLTESCTPEPPCDDLTEPCSPEPACDDHPLISAQTIECLPLLPYPKKAAIRTCLLKCDTQSSIIIPNGSSAHTSYPLAILTLDNSRRNICQTIFTFSCNIRTEQAILFLNFRITQQGKDFFIPIPIQSNWNYSRQSISSMTDAVTFSTCCNDLIPDEWCTICFWADLIVVSQGTSYIANSILTALIQEKI